MLIHRSNLDGGEWLHPTAPFCVLVSTNLSNPKEEHPQHTRDKCG
jgi:hypothetical protein